jgi:hypothetical protein
MSSLTEVGEIISTDCANAASYQQPTPLSRRLIVNFSDS